jgi:hypothetical protein
MRNLNYGGTWRTVKKIKTWDRTNKKLKLINKTLDLIILILIALFIILCII